MQEQEQVAPEEVVPVEATTEAPEAEAAEVVETPEQPRDDQGKFKPKLQERIDELTRARREAEREAAYWRQLAAKETESAKPAKPTPDQFTDYSEYVEALTEFKAGAKVAEVLGKQASDKQVQTAQDVRTARIRQFEDRETSFRKSVPDFDAVMETANIPISQAVADSILESDVGPQLRYYLAKNPDVTVKLSEMSPLAAAREIGKLEVKLQATPATKTSSAPAPISPVKGGTTRNPSSDPAKMTHEEYRAFRSKQGARWAK